METVLISGGTGMIGKELAKSLLAKNYEVIILTRGADTGQPVAANLSYAKWDIHKQIIDKGAITRADYIIHLAGAGVADKRWTKKRKQEIVDSRVKCGELISKALQENTNKVKAIISISGIGWYGPDPVIPNPNPFTEEDPASDDFLATTCKQWEASLAPVIKQGKRLVIMRTGIVLNKGGGALKEFERPLKFGVSTILGTGKQVISWIHINDLVGLFIEAVENENIKGVYNAVSPNPVSNKEFMMKLAVIKRGKFFIPVYVPSFALKLVLGEMSMEVLKSATVSCVKLHYAGFAFVYPTVDAALNDLSK
jgi:uncharacterized protein (TIGR01777 family)